MKIIKCDFFVLHRDYIPCDRSIEVSDNYKEACEVMDLAGWRKCGNATYHSYPKWAIFCPIHAKHNQFYSEGSK